MSNRDAVLYDAPNGSGIAYATLARSTESTAGRDRAVAQKRRPSLSPGGAKIRRRSCRREPPPASTGQLSNRSPVHRRESSHAGSLGHWGPVQGPEREPQGQEGLGHQDHQRPRHLPRTRRRQAILGEPRHVSAVEGLLGSRWWSSFLRRTGKRSWVRAYSPGARADTRPDRDAVPPAESTSWPPRGPADTRRRGR